MSTVDELISFLRARFDEDEEIARRVLRYARESYAWHPPERWVAARTGPEKTILRVQTDRGEHLVRYSVVDLDYMTGEALANYLCRNDPARIMADLAAKRRILGWADSPALPDIERFYVLTALAQPYADHEDFRDDWKV